jgi:hypothetical protein
MRADGWIAALLRGLWLWIMVLAVLFFAGNLATSKFIYVDF